MGRSSISLLLGTGLLLSSCANSSLGEALQKSLAADPKLKQTASSGQLRSLTGTSPSAAVQLPADFPTEIPRYPNGTLQAVLPATQDPNRMTLTQWQSQDGSDRILAFYRQAFQSGWQVLRQPANPNQGTLVGQQDDLQVWITAQPNAVPDGASPAPSPSSGSTYEIRYIQTNGAVQPTASPSASPSAASDPLEFAAGASGTSDRATSEPTSEPTSGTSIPFTDLTKAPQELQRYISDLAQLGILTASTAGTKTATAPEFSPNTPISRRDYARWLVSANNRLYANQPAQQIRLALTTAQPAFKDVPSSDPDFAAIQGLAEAGIIPSQLSNTSSIVTFRPDAQLSREDLLLWKVPIDTPKPLPTASLDVVKQTWGFQDAAQIDPKALRAVQADYQNGDLSNIRRAFGYTKLLQPKKPVTRAEAAATVWYFGVQGEGMSAETALQQNNPS